MNTSAVEYNYVPDDLVNDILDRFVTPKENILSGYIIVINGQIFNNGAKGFIFPSREQAIKAFYNSMSWRAKYKILRHDYGENYYNRTINNNARAESWKRFKKTLTDKYNFEIIRLG